MTKKFISLPFTLFVISVALLNFTHFTACASQLRVDGNSLIVEASGRGRTMTAAKIDARRNAAQQALGFMLEGTTLFETLSENGRNESKLEEKILRLTRAFIAEGEEELSRSEDEKRHIFSVTLRVRVSGAELLNGLLRKGPERSDIDGASLVGKAIAYEQRKKETANALIELMTAFPVADYVRVKAVNAGNFDIKKQELKLNVNFKFDRARYFSEAVPSIVSVLDYVSEARISDVPFLMPSENLNDGIASITPSENIRTIGQYLKLMEVNDGNRVIKDSGYANIYVQTRDYYFNAYRVIPEAFRELVYGLFESDGRGNFTGMKGNAELIINFTNESGRLVPSKPAGIKNLRNIMFFMNTPEPSMFSWISRNDLSNEIGNAVFILPAFGFDEGQGREYVLYQEENAELPAVKVAAEELLNLGRGSSAQCSIVIKGSGRK